MKPSINLSINPSYYCNFRCTFCYLTPEQLADKKRLPLEVLARRLVELSKDFTIGSIDLYGGEPLMLPPKYLGDLRVLLQQYGVDGVNVSTNLSVDTPIITDEYFYISVSYDFGAREKQDEVFERMLTLTRPFSMLILCTPELMNADIDNCIHELNMLSQLATVEIKPYSSNQANQLDVSDEDFETVVKAFIESPVKKKFEFFNERLLNNVLDGIGQSFSDDHVYITPTGHFAVLDFDEANNEKFTEFDTVEQYHTWCRDEKQRVSENVFCSNCQFYGKCLSEHLRPVESTDNSCNGFIKLIEWYEEDA